MAALGAGLSADGESGTVDSPVINQTDVIQNNKKDIVQTTSIETVNHILTRDWVYSRTYNIDTSMKPGQLFGFIRIHPQDCNPYVNYVAKMFKTWTGGMKVRARFMANFANGGSFRIGFLPPVFTKADIQSLPLSTLTAYPNQDLDPKNTDWTEFRTSDQRNIAYHYMQDPDAVENTANFGGWIVFYVVGTLVQSLQTSGAVQMVVETAGDFEFRQLAPLTFNSNTSGPFTAESLHDILEQPFAEDRMCTQDHALYALSKDITSVNMGFFLTYGFNGKFSGDGKTTVPPYVYSMRTAMGGGNRNLRYTLETDVSALGTDTCEVHANSDWAPASTPFMKFTTQFHNTSEQSTADDVYLKVIGYSGNYSKWKCTISDTKGGVISIPRTAKTARLGFTRDAITATLGYKSWVTQFGPEPQPLANQFPNESILIFYDSTRSSFSLQTLSMSQDLKNGRAKPGVTYLYKLNKGTTQIGWVRLQENGMMTTNAVNTTIAYNVLDLNLEYVQELSPSSPLPPNPAPAYTLERMMITRKAHKHGLTVQQAEEKYLGLQ